VLGYTRTNETVTVRELGAQGAMTALLRDALQPNLVQTMENNPSLMHGGPFANIAHGCNSVMATKTGLKLADYVVTEAGFGADLGAEKFFNIKCRKAGLSPDAVVLVATIKALKMQGGVAKADLGEENVEALQDGCKNLERHMRNLAKFGVPVAVAINRFTADTDAEVETVRKFCEDFGVKAINCTYWADGGRPSTARIGLMVAREQPNSLSTLSSSVTVGPPSSVRSTVMMCRCGTKRQRLLAKSMAPKTSSLTRRCAISSRDSSVKATASTRYAWRRRSTVSRQIRICSVPRLGTMFRSVRSVSRRVLSSSLS